MKNAEWLISRGISLRNVCRYVNDNMESIWYYDTTDGRYHELYNGERLGESDKTSILTWLDMEHTEQILDEIERQYLSSVIKPFKERAVFVRKDCHKGLDGGRYEQIVIRVKSAMPDSFADIELPFFKEGTMYKGMKIYKEYTMKELGL